MRAESSLNDIKRSSLVRRVLGALCLDAATYEEVEADRTATTQAMLVVVLSSLGAAIGNARGSSGLTLEAVALGLAISLLGWISWALLLLFLGTRLMPTADTRADAGELLRTIGFAAAPGMLRAVEIFGIARPLWFPLTSIWMIAATTMAAKQALDYASTARAVAVCALGWAISVAVAAGIGILFPTPVS